VNVVGNADALLLGSAYADDFDDAAVVLEWEEWIDWKGREKKLKNEKKIFGEVFSYFSKILRVLPNGSSKALAC
jgi:hypothetical protein